MKKAVLFLLSLAIVSLGGCDPNQASDNTPDTKPNTKPKAEPTAQDRLFEAIAKMDAIGIQKALEEGASLQSPNQDGYNAVEAAILHSRKAEDSLLDALLELDDGKGMALFYAARKKFPSGRPEPSQRGSAYRRGEVYFSYFEAAKIMDKKAIFEAFSANKK